MVAVCIVVIMVKFCEEKIETRDVKEEQKKNGKHQTYLC
jgi:hypothetical protein